jgi:MoxR-like ATPase
MLAILLKLCNTYNTKIGNIIIVGGQIMAREKVAQIRENIEKAVVCKGDLIELVIAAVLSRGHVLIEDVPGIGKTTLVRALAASIGCSFQRIQFTPDVMPSDVTGFTMVDIATGELKFRKGAIMHQIVLADEINRTSPKTQSSLLEAMQEGQVTIDSKTYEMPKPFIVLATQNPIEHIGTFPLPEAQLDRFFIKISLGYPGIRDEIDILDRHDGVPSPIYELKPVVSADEIISMQNEVDKVVCSDAIKEYIALIVGQTRSNTDLLLGASPRGAIALMQGAKAWAYIHGNDYVTPDDVLYMTPHILAHRLLLRPEAKLKDMTAVRILKNITNMIRIPDSL